MQLKPDRDEAIPGKFAGDARRIFAKRRPTSASDCEPSFNRIEWLGLA